MQYAKEREVFQGPIGAHQAIAHPLAQSHIEIELARLMTQKAAALYDAGDDLAAGEAANMAKYAAAEAACDAADRAVQTHGGNGITQEYGMAGLLVAARAGRIAPVCREMILNFVSMHSLGLPKSTSSECLTVSGRSDAARACHHRPVTVDDLTRRKEKRRDRAELDRLLDEVLVGTLATVTTDGRPWAVPMLFARDGDRVLLHGSTGAGALRRVAAGAEAVVAVTAIDALVLATSLFEHSANYRSAVVRGPLRPLVGDEAVAALDGLSDALVPGRRAEVRGSSRRRSPPPSLSRSTSPTTTGCSR